MRVRFAWMHLGRGVPGSTLKADEKRRGIRCSAAPAIKPPRYGTTQGEGSVSRLTGRSCSQLPATGRANCAFKPRPEMRLPLKRRVKVPAGW